MTIDTLPILYEEPHFLLVNKPAGLFTQAAPGVPSLEVQLSEQLKNRDQHPGRPFVGLPHRLDRATSGVLLVARNQRALARFGQQFQSRKVEKYYVAVVEGELPPGVQEWDDRMRKIPDRPQAEVVEPHVRDGKLARLRIESLATGAGRTLAVVQLLTGRMHQIRMQTAHRGWPVVGDRLYGGQTLSAATTMPPSELREQPHALHAFRLGFFHPRSALRLSISAPVPENWRDVLAADILDDVAGLVERSRLLAS